MGTMPPLGELRRRVRTHGRIRLGVQVDTGKVKNGKKVTRPEKLSTFRFTSADKVAIEQIAAMHGGEVEPWHDEKATPKDQWQVIVPVNSIEVWLPPDSMSVDYELWGGAGRERVCDGVTVDREEKRGYEFITVSEPCICNARGKRECGPVTRLSVILPGVNFGGVWRMESKGWNAAEELPGIAEQIEALQADGLLVARLTLDQRASRGGQRQYVVPALELVVTPQQMLEGKAAVAAIGPAAAPALESPQVALPSAPWDPDDEVAEAEIVEEPEGFYSLALRALDADPEGPMLSVDDVMRLLVGEPAEVERKLRGVIDGKARFVMADGELKVVKR